MTRRAILVSIMAITGVILLGTAIFFDSIDPVVVQAKSKSCCTLKCGCGCKEALNKGKSEAYNYCTCSRNGNNPFGLCECKDCSIKYTK